MNTTVWKTPFWPEGVANDVSDYHFPLFKFNKDDQRWVSEHHPFTSFRAEDMEYLEKGEFAKIRSNSYDLILNGSEIGSGSIRIHDKDIQAKIFEIGNSIKRLGLSVSNFHFLMCDGCKRRKTILRDNLLDETPKNLITGD